MVESAYSAVWNDSLYKADYVLSLKGYICAIKLFNPHSSATELSESVMFAARIHPWWWGLWITTCYGEAQRNSIFQPKYNFNIHGCSIIMKYTKARNKSLTVHLDVCHNWDQLNHHKHWYHEHQNNQYLMYNT